MARTIQAQGCTVDKELNFPNLNLCGASQSEFCQTHDQVMQRLAEPDTLCGDSEQALCDRLQSVETAVTCQSEETLCDRLDAVEASITAPRLLCGVPEEEYCAVSAMAQSDQEASSVVNPDEIVCLASPEGEVRFFRTNVDCPCGFTDVTDTYRNRFVSIGEAGTEIGTNGESLATRSTTVTSTVSGITSEMLEVLSGRGGANLMYLKGTEPFTASGPVSTADIAPSLSLKVCERQGMCNCDVNA